MEHLHLEQLDLGLDLPQCTSGVCCVCQQKRKFLPDGKIDPLLHCMSTSVYQRLMKGVYVSVIDEAGQELEKRKNEMLQNPALRVTESSCNRAFHTTCLGRPPAAAHARQLTCTRDVFEEGGSVPLG
ncbi:hypothetical protein ABBQ32_008598 [Trebouxia sp. C0010 RCD-2024]